MREFREKLVTTVAESILKTGDVNITHFLVHPEARQVLAGGIVDFADQLIDEMERGG